MVIICNFTSVNFVSVFVIHNHKNSFVITIVIQHIRFVSFSEFICKIFSMYVLYVDTDEPSDAFVAKQRVPTVQPLLTRPKSNLGFHAK
jgi:hypothetical protein